MNNKDNFNDLINVDRLSSEALWLWNHINLKFRITSYISTYFAGNSVGTEYLIYKANVIYLATSILFGGGGSTAFIPTVQLFDENNASIGYFCNASAFMNVAVISAAVNSFKLENVYFSRLNPQGYANFILNGYRIEFLP